MNTFVVDRSSYQYLRHQLNLELSLVFDLQFIVLATYEKLVGFECKGRIKEYKSLFEAKLECSINSTCAWIENKQCYHKGQFSLCSTKEGLRSEVLQMVNGRLTDSSCVYEKTENFGKCNARVKLKPL